MLDIYSIPLFYISFKPNPDVENHYRSYGFKNIRHFEAVRGKDLDAEKMLKDNKLTIRAYRDLVKDERVQHSGLASMGAIGCTVSHFELWSYAVQKDLPYILIAEEDNRIGKPFSEKNIKDIEDALSKPNGVFMSVKLRKKEPEIDFFGTHFYFLTNGACKALIHKTFPIDIQTDHYIAHMCNVGGLSFSGYPISESVMFKGSSIQNFCFSCIMPRKIGFYIFTLLFIVLIIFYLLYKWRSCSSKPF